MTIFINILLVMVNLGVIIAGYFIVKNRIKQKLVKKEVIEEVKKEINSLMVSFNETTHHNITLLEDKIRILNKVIALADKKIHGLESYIEKIDRKKEEKRPPGQKLTYSPQKIIKQSRKQTEILKSNQSNKAGEDEFDNDNETVLKELEGLTIIEKIKTLITKGKTREEVRKILKLDRGEFDLLINFEDINFDA